MFARITECSDTHFLPTACAVCQCSRSCGGGVQERGVFCPGGLCDWTKRPASTVPCNRHLCCHWATGNWELVRVGYRCFVPPWLSTKKIYSTFLKFLNFLGGRLALGSRGRHVNLPWIQIERTMGLRHRGIEPMSAGLCWCPRWCGYCGRGLTCVSSYGRPPVRQVGWWGRGLQARQSAKGSDGGAEQKDNGTQGELDGHYFNYIT